MKKGRNKYELQSKSLQDIEILPVRPTETNRAKDQKTDQAAAVINFFKAIEIKQKTPQRKESEFSNRVSKYLKTVKTFA